jgi:uncharacterized membrane protein
MIGSLDALFAATTLFVGGHFLLSSVPVRLALIEHMGETRYLGWYSVAMLAVFGWMILAFITAPIETPWLTPASLRWVTALVMPLAIFLIVCGITTPSPTIAGSARPRPGAT